MHSRQGAGREVERAVLTLAADHPRLALAVSGGLDSMVLLEAAAELVPSRVALVANFDHGTGEHARAAAELVGERAGELGLPFVVARATRALEGEAAWREARWRFLRESASVAGAVVVTAHSRDDQVETVFMRALRGAGARGLAGLAAPSDVARPFVELDRSTIALYARSRGVRHVEDPSNRSLRYLRNRVRLELLPALTSVRPALRQELLEVARRAASLRREVDAIASTFVEREDTGNYVLVASGALGRYDSESLRLLWPALAARVGATLDRRGTLRLAAFTMESEPGSRIQLSGGWEVLRRRDAFELRPRRARRAVAAQPLVGVVQLGGWRLRPAGKPLRDTAWSAALPRDRQLVVRPWRPGDRITASGAARPRRVKRFLSEAGVLGPDRADWPVVLADGEIIWVPGLCRSDAATARSGRPAVMYLCDRTDS